MRRARGSLSLDLKLWSAKVPLAVGMVVDVVGRVVEVVATVEVVITWGVEVIYVECSWSCDCERCSWRERSDWCYSHCVLVVKQPDESKQRDGQSDDEQCREQNEQNDRHRDARGAGAQSPVFAAPDSHTRNFRAATSPTACQATRFLHLSRAQFSCLSSMQTTVRVTDSSVRN